jgi:hypothetical protein
VFEIGDEVLLVFGVVVLGEVEGFGEGLLSGGR